MPLCWFGLLTRQKRANLWLNLGLDWWYTFENIPKIDVQQNGILCFLDIGTISQVWTVFNRDLLSLFFLQISDLLNICSIWVRMFRFRCPRKSRERLCNFEQLSASHCTLSRMSTWFSHGGKTNARFSRLGRMEIILINWIISDVLARSRLMATLEKKERMLISVFLCFPFQVQNAVHGSHQQPHDQIQEFCLKF